MTWRKYIHLVQLIVMVLLGTMLSTAALARPTWQKRGGGTETTLGVTHDLSGGGEAYDPANQYDSPSADEPAPTSYEVEAFSGDAVIEADDALTDKIVGHTQAGDRLILSLDECVLRALERNMQLKAANKDIDAAQGQLTEAKAAFWPVIEYKYRMAPVPTDVDNAWSSFWSGEVTFFNSIHVGIGMPITTFGQLHMAKRLAQGGVEAARIRTRQAEADVVYNVKKIYYGIQLAHESIKLLNEAISKLNDKIRSEEERAEEEDEGEEDELADVNDRLDPYDILEMKAWRVEFERRLDEAKQNLELAYDAMRMQLDLHPGAEIGLDSYTLKPKLASLDREEEFIEGGMKHDNNVNLLDVGVETRRRQYKLEKFKLAPKFGFGFFVDIGRSAGEIRGLQLTDDYNDPFNYTRAGLGFQLQGTIDFHGAYGRIKKARAEYHKAVYERIIARRALTMDTRKAYLEAKRAKENVGRTKKEWSMANQMMFLSKVNVDIGIGDKDKYADALKYLMLSRGRYFKAVFDYNMALAELEKRVGRERYAEYVPTPDIDEMEAFRYDGDEEENGGWITIGGQNDTYGVETEDGGVTDGSFEE